MQLSIVIPYFSKVDSLTKSLFSIEKSSRKLFESGEHNLEVVVVNDASPSFPEIGEYSFKVVCFKNEINRGVAYSRNRGICESTYEWFLCLDSDVFISENFLTRLAEIIEGDRHHEIIQGIISHEVDEDSISKSDFSRYLALSFSYDAFEYSDLLCSGCFASTKEYMSKIGMFKEHFKKSGGEEFEILSRIEKGSIFQEDSLVATHSYEDLIPRVKKIFFRSQYYMDSAVLNDHFPRKFKIVGIIRAILSGLTTIFALGALFLFYPFALMSLITIIGIAVSDGGGLVKYIYKHTNLKLALKTPFYVYIEFVAAVLGVGKSLISIRRERC